MKTNFLPLWAWEMRRYFSYMSVFLGLALAAAPLRAAADDKDDNKDDNSDEEPLSFPAKPKKRREGMSFTAGDFSSMAHTMRGEDTSIGRDDEGRYFWKQAVRNIDGEDTTVKTFFIVGRAVRSYNTGNYKIDFKADLDQVVKDQGSFYVYLIDTKKEVKDKNKDTPLVVLEIKYDSKKSKDLGKIVKKKEIDATEKMKVPFYQVTVDENIAAENIEQKLTKKKLTLDFVARRRGIDSYDDLDNNVHNELYFREVENLLEKEKKSLKTIDPEKKKDKKTKEVIAHELVTMVDNAEGNAKSVLKVVLNSTDKEDPPTADDITTLTPKKKDVVEEYKKYLKAESKKVVDDLNPLAQKQFTKAYFAKIKGENTIKSEQLKAIVEDKSGIVNGHYWKGIGEDGKRIWIPNPKFPRTLHASVAGEVNDEEKASNKNDAVKAILNKKLLDVVQKNDPDHDSLEDVMVPMIVTLNKGEKFFVLMRFSYTEEKGGGKVSLIKGGCKLKKSKDGENDPSVSGIVVSYSVQKGKARPLTIDKIEEGVKEYIGDTVKQVNFFIPSKAEEDIVWSYVMNSLSEEYNLGLTQKAIQDIYNTYGGAQDEILLPCVAREGEDEDSQDVEYVKIKFAEDTGTLEQNGAKNVKCEKNKNLINFTVFLTKDTPLTSDNFKLSAIKSNDNISDEENEYEYTLSPFLNEDELLESLKGIKEDGTPPNIEKNKKSTGKKKHTKNQSIMEPLALKPKDKIEIDKNKLKEYGLDNEQLINKYRAASIIDTLNRSSWNLLWKKEILSDDDKKNLGKLIAQKKEAELILKELKADIKDLPLDIQMLLLANALKNLDNLVLPYWGSWSKQNRVIYALKKELHKEWGQAADLKGSYEHYTTNKNKIKNITNPKEDVKGLVEKIDKLHKTLDKEVVDIESLPKKRLTFITCTVVLITSASCWNMRWMKKIRSKIGLYALEDEEEYDDDEYDYEQDEDDDELEEEEEEEAPSQNVHEEETI